MYRPLSVEKIWLRFHPCFQGLRSQFLPPSYSWTSKLVCYECKSILWWLFTEKENEATLNSPQTWFEIKARRHNVCPPTAEASYGHTKCGKGLWATCCTWFRDCHSRGSSHSDWNSTCHATQVVLGLPVLEIFCEIFWGSYCDAFNTFLVTAISVIRRQFQKK